MTNVKCFLYSVEGGMPLQDSFLIFLLIIVSSFNNVAIISFIIRVLYIMVLQRKNWEQQRNAQKNRINA